jgi:fatty acid desaturase
MKQYPQEQILLKGYLRNSKLPEFSENQSNTIKQEIIKLRQNANDSVYAHFLLELLPFIVLFLTWYALIFFLPSLIVNKKLLFILIITLHGSLAYQWVVYGLHEGAGHELFKGRKSFFHKTFQFLAFHSSRLLMADPVHYKLIHSSHHKHTGTEKDEAQTNFVLIKRIIKSILPGAGILFSNDYRIHKGDKVTSSLILSISVGMARFFCEYQALKIYFSTFEIVLMLLILSPWIGLTLDRIRESLEHHLMPQSRIYGTRELGLTPLALFISGGPWGQPCHLSHHLAPDLNWYQQILFHNSLKNILSNEQKDFFGFNTTLIPLISRQIKTHLKIERTIWN